MTFNVVGYLVLVIVVLLPSMEHASLLAFLCKICSDL